MSISTLLLKSPSPAFTIAFATLFNLLTILLIIIVTINTVATIISIIVIITFIITPLLTSTCSSSFIKLIIFHPVLDISVERYLYVCPFKSISPFVSPSFEIISKIFFSSTFVWTFDISLLSDNIVPSLFIKTEYPVLLKLFSEK